MFERRLKFLLVFLLVLLTVLVARVVQVQVWQHSEWTEKAKASLKRAQLVDTVRGGIYDVQGRQIALDVACIDACVDYRVIQNPPDERWVRDEARRRLRGKLDGLSRAERTVRIDEEVLNVKADIDRMWEVLGGMPGASPDRVSETRISIIQKVERRRKFVLYKNYERAMRTHEASQAGAASRPSWMRQWLAGADADAPKLADFETDVGEQLEAHPILRNVSAEVNNFLAKNQDRLPGLILRPGITRAYPYGQAGAHLMGHLTRVNRDDLAADDSEDELRQYLPSDLIGRAGLEALFENELRGSRGRRVRVSGVEQEAEFVDPVKGRDVRTTVDIALQSRIQALFAKATVHGAAVVIDVPTGEVRALASYPAYDPNSLDVEMRRLLEDEINLPMMNRATTAMLEPGSTVKPLVGLAAISQGVVGLHERISCNGFLVIGGRQQKVGRCWTMKMFQLDHRYVPSTDPHPSGDLDFVDAVQRSCNIYFEVCGDRLGIPGLSTWYDKFGLGRPTGVGVMEASGLIPSGARIPTYARRSSAWFAGIGQGKIQATPIQMANVVATIARDGTWRRPRLVPAGTPLPARLAADGIPEQADLGLSTEAVRLARQGMTKVVNTRAGSGNAIKRDDLLVAGKTGTAQAAPFTFRKRDENGNLVRDEKGNVVREELRLSTAGNPNPLAPWYRGTGKTGDERAHAWFIGFAPAENPKIAFCVLVEYGGGGGTVAAPVAKDILQACIDAGYVPGKRSPEAAPQGPATPDAVGFLVR